MSEWCQSKPYFWAEYLWVPLFPWVSPAPNPHLPLQVGETASYSAVKFAFWCVLLEVQGECWFLYILVVCENQVMLSKLISECSSQMRYPISLSQNPPENIQLLSLCLLMTTLVSMSSRAVVLRPLCAYRSSEDLVKMQIQIQYVLNGPKALHF